MCTGDDLSIQDRLLLSPQIYRDIIKPRQSELINHIKHYTSAGNYQTFENIMGIPYTISIISLCKNVAQPFRLAKFQAGSVGYNAHLIVRNDIMYRPIHFQKLLCIISENENARLYYVSGIRTGLKLD